MKKNGYTAMEMLIVIIVLGVVTLGMIATTSYAFKDRGTSDYEEIEHLILRQAKMYGENSDILKKDGNLIITLDDLIEAGYYVADDESGAVVDVRNSKATLNGLKIKLSYENGNVFAKIIEED